MGCPLDQVPVQSFGTVKGNLGGDELPKGWLKAHAGKVRVQIVDGADEKPLELGTNGFGVLEHFFSSSPPNGGASAQALKTAQSLGFPCFTIEKPKSIEEFLAMLLSIAWIGQPPGVLFYKPLQG